jgi:hypothetical protein
LLRALIYCIYKDAKPPKKEEDPMSIFERKELPLSAAPLYYQALSELVEKHWTRLWPRLDTQEAEARAYLNLYRGEVSAFQQTVVAHIDQQTRTQGSTAKRNQHAKEASAWIGLIRRAAGVAVRGIPDKLEQRQLKSVVHVGRQFAKNSPGAVLLEARYLSAILPGLTKQLSPPLHQEELSRGAAITASLEVSLYGRANATAEQLKASVAKGKAWNILEEKSKLLLELARLEFSKDPAHKDYAMRLQFEGLDEKFAPLPKAAATDPTSKANV